jgi:3-oxoacyl-[acyl-carrier protein] reductase
VDLGLKGKVAMVAGASRGLGYAVARRLAAEGARVSILSRREEDVAAAARRIQEETGAEVLAVPGSVTSVSDLEAWQARTRERFDGVDLLLTNSGGPPPGGALSFDDAAWQAGFELLLLSAVRMARLVVPSMKARGGGAILMATSSSVKEPLPNLTLSTVLRAGVSALAKSLALELAPEKIRVNQIVPGRIETDRVRQMDVVNGTRLGISAEEARARSTATIPLARYGAPDEFGAAAAFLLSDAASYITGATLQVDGGLLRTIL